MSKGSSQFADPSQMAYLSDKELPERIEVLNQSINDTEKYIDGMTDLHSTLDLAHPFREGNGRATRAFMSQLAKGHGYELDFSKVEREQWVEACIDSINSGQESLKRPQIEQIVTPTRERIVKSAIVNLSADNSPENKQKIVTDLQERGIKSDEIYKETEALKKIN